MNDKVGISMEIKGTGKFNWVFTPRYGDGKWLMDMSQSFDGEKRGIIIPMKEFLKVCRAFAADAENYKDER